MEIKKKFGLLSVCAVVIVLILLLCTNTCILFDTDVFVEGEGEELIENVLETVKGGQRFVLMSRLGDEDFNHLIDIIFDDPELFWVDMKYNALSIGKINMLYLHKRYKDIDATQMAIDSMVNKVVAEIKAEHLGEYNRVLAIHDWICEHVVYGEAEDDSDQDIYGAIVRGKARCAGYAKAFSYLLNKIGIESQVISGESIDKNGERISHAWNLVYIDDEPYYFDVTWNDNDEGQTYEWFGVTSQEFQLSHFPSEGYEWVEATSVDASYYIRNHMYVKQYSATQIVRQISQQGMTFDIKCANGEVLDQTIKAFGDRAELQKIMKGAGLSYVDQITYVENPYTNCLHVEIIR